jgi:hypothetical protein
MAKEVRYMYLKIVDILIDYSYQRGRDERRIRAIAKRFSDSRMEPPTVNERIEDGKYYVLDGGHRIGAAALAGRTELYCRILSLPAAQEPSVFSSLNNDRVRLSGFDLFRADLKAGEESAVALWSLLKKYNLTLATTAKTGRHISCLGFLWKKIKSTPKTLDKTLDICARSLKPGAEYGCPPETVKGIHHALCFINPNVHQRLEERLIHVGSIALTRAAREGAARNGKNTNEYYASGIIHEVNKSLRERNRFKLENIYYEEYEAEDLI